MSITIRPLSAHPLPPTYLLTVDSARILLDCGAYDKSNEVTLPDSAEGEQKREPDAPTHAQVTEYLSTLRDLAPTLNLVLLSHPLLTSLGLLPYLRARCGLRCPVYATLPTREMGRYAVEEWAEARSTAERNDARYEQLQQNQSAAAAAKADAAAVVKKRKGKAAKVEKPAEDVAMVDGLETDSKPLSEGAEPMDGVQENGAKDGDESRSDPWDSAWKLTIQEIRDAFLAINAVRWTQPIHLTGKPAPVPCESPPTLTRICCRRLEGLHHGGASLRAHSRWIAVHPSTLAFFIPIPRFLCFVFPLRSRLQPRQGASPRPDLLAQRRKRRRFFPEDGSCRCRGAAESGGECKADRSRTQDARSVSGRSRISRCRAAR